MSILAHVYLCLALPILPSVVRLLGTLDFHMRLVVIVADQTTLVALCVGWFLRDVLELEEVGRLIMIGVRVMARTISKFRVQIICLHPTGLENLLSYSSVESLDNYALVSLGNYGLSTVVWAQNFGKRLRLCAYGEQPVRQRLL